MTRTPKYLFWLLPLLMLVIAVAVGYLIWNKPHKKAENQQAVVVMAEDIYNQFSENDSSANATYLNKVLQVHGTASEVTKNADGNTVVLIAVPDPLGGVQCTMRDKDVAVTLQSTVTLKGFCNGFTGVVLLSECVPVAP